MNLHTNMADSVFTAYIGNDTIRRQSRSYKIEKSKYNHMIASGEITPLSDEEKNAHKWTRYSKPEQMHTGLRWPKNGNKGKTRMDKFNKMTLVQKEKILELMSKGLSKIFAMDMAGCTVRMLNYELKNDDVFRDKVVSYEQFSNAKYENVIETAGDQDPSWALQVLKWRLEKESRSNTMKIEHRKIKQKDKELELKGAALSEVKRGIQRLNFEGLSMKELERMNILEEKYGLNKLTHEEVGELLSLYSKRNNQLEVTSQAAKALEHVQEVDDMFDEDNEE